MNPAVLIASVYVFALAAFLGYQVISRVPPLLHTPLMSATNAISGISLIGSLVLAGATRSPVAHILGCIAVTTATINVVGGFGGQRDQSGAIIGKGWRDEGLPVSSDIGDAGYQALRAKAGL